MLRLNDDCLCHIFDRLELRDQITLTAVCERFRDIIVAVQWRSRFRRFVYYSYYSERNGLSREEYQSLFKLIAHRIEHLVINRDYGGGPHLTFFRHLEFPILRRLECYHRFNEGEMQVLVAHYPLIEELHLHGMVFRNTWPHIVRMRHLRVLHLSHCWLKECDFQQILTLPLTELSVFSFVIRDNSRLVAEALIGASKLRILGMHYTECTPGLMKSIVDLASTTELRDPLTVYINYGRGVYSTPYYKESHEDDQYIPTQDERNPCFFYYNYNSFMEYKRTLQTLMDKQCPSYTYTILLSEWKIEFRFFCQSNEK